MTSKKISGTIETAYGKNLDTPLAYEGTTELFDTVEEAKSANAWPSDKEILKSVNADLVQAATASFRKAQLDAAGIKAPTAEDPEVAFKILVKTLVAQGKTQAKAEELATAMLS